MQPRQSSTDIWQANYKSMNSQQLVAELERIAKRPHFYDNHIERKACIATELAMKVRAPDVPIILLEDE
jgi:hypothetical protein